MVAHTSNGVTQKDVHADDWLGRKQKRRGSRCRFCYSMYTGEYPSPLPCLLPQTQKDSLAAMKRLEGLHKRVNSMIEHQAYCADILEQLLAMQGHLKYIQALVLESHLQTCTTKRMTTPKEARAFVQELTRVIGLSQRR